MTAKYSIIMADPPWHYTGDPNKDQAAGKHYKLMSNEDIWNMDVKSIAAKNSVLFLWATGPRLDVAVKTVKEWGFHYRGVAYVWVKTTLSGKIINGQGVRPTLTKPTTEFVLAGTSCRSGRPLKLFTEAQGQVVLAARGRHSEKPEEVRTRIEELLVGDDDVKKIELFARKFTPGWDAHGDEIHNGVTVGGKA